jgi:hypothetical protein
VSYTINSATREVAFRFSGINLAPSSSNLDDSQGYFTYTIDELPNLILDSEIKNTAYIYFDFNPPIVTNTTINTNSYLTSGINDINNEFKLNIFPNPTNGKFTLNLSENATVKIYSLIGSLIFYQEFHKGQILDLTNFQKGIYNLQVKTPKRIYSQKLILQ